MKNSIALIAGLALMGAAQSQAALQATIWADNYGAGAGAISDASGLLPATAWIQVFGGASGSSLTSLGAAFHPAEPGYFDNSIMLVPGVTAGASAVFQVQAWEGAADYASATVKGASALITQTTGSWEDGVGGTNPPGPKSGPELNVTAFTISASTPNVPEPTTLALGVLGAAALLFRRRQ